MNAIANSQLFQFPMFNFLEESRSPGRSGSRTALTLIATPPIIPKGELRSNCPYTSTYQPTLTDRPSPEKLLYLQESENKKVKKGDR